MVYKFFYKKYSEANTSGGAVTHAQSFSDLSYAK